MSLFQETSIFSTSTSTSTFSASEQRTLPSSSADCLCSSSAPSHNIKPGRRRGSFSRGRTTTLRPAQLWILVLLALTAWCGISEAGILPPGDVIRDAEFLDYERRGEILIDRRAAPRVDRLNFPRQNGDLFGSSTTDTPTTIPISSLSKVTATPVASTTPAPKTKSTAPTTTVNNLASTTLMTSPGLDTNSPLPKPFDTSLGSNFTSSACPSFFNSFLNNVTFQACLPFSLLLQNSNSFFVAEHSIAMITKTLDASCNASFTTCSSLMSQLATSLIDPSNCGPDFQQQNSIVTQAYAGLVAYSPLYQAGCLKDPAGNYCFADAITNTTSPADSYVYFLPLGIQLPGASRPTCSYCLQQTMNYFANAAENLTQPVSNTYSAAAYQIDAGCGPTFVNTSVTPIKGTQPASGADMLTGLGLAPLVLTLLVALLSGFL